MSKHTPGPWSVGKVSHKKQRVDIDSRSYDEFMGNQRWTGLARTYGCEDCPEKGSEASMTRTSTQHHTGEPNEHEISQEASSYRSVPDD